MKRGEGRVYRKPGSRYWHMEYWDDGRSVRKSTKQTTEEAARAVLDTEREAVRAGETTPEEDTLTLRTLQTLLVEDYTFKRNRSTETMQFSFKHLIAFFGPKAGIKKISRRAKDYVAHRRSEGAAEASIRMELALLRRSFTVAVENKLLVRGAVPDIKRPPEDKSRIRKGFFTREDVERLQRHLPVAVADLVGFLFWSAWRVNEGRRLEWRFYDAGDGVIRLPAELSKNNEERLLPVEAELAAIIERRLTLRRLDCPFIFHHHGRPIGDFRKVWRKACAAIGLSGRIVHDLRRSGVKHLIEAGIDPYTVMAFSGHKTESMLRRYKVVDLDALRVAAARGAAHSGNRSNVRVLPTRTEPAQSPVDAATAGSRG